MGNQDIQEVKKLQEVPRTPVCCDTNMSRTIVGGHTGSPRYQYYCLKCNKQQRGEEMIKKQTTGAK